MVFHSLMPVKAPTLKSLVEKAAAAVKKEATAEPAQAGEVASLAQKVGLPGGVYFCLAGPHDGVGRVGRGRVFPSLHAEIFKKRKFPAKSRCQPSPSLLGIFVHTG